MQTSPAVCAGKRNHPNAYRLSKAPYPSPRSAVQLGPLVRGGSVVACTVPKNRASPPYRSLDALNFFLADVHGGLGPYLAVYLLTVRHWDEAEIGIMMSIAGIAGIIAQTPAGALVDAVRAKRAIIVIAALIVTTG